MKIVNNTMVSLIYQLREASFDGEIIEEIQEAKPLNFIFGSGKLLPAFEANILYLKPGDSFSFNLNAEHAYGTKREELIMDIPISVFENEGKVDEEICRVGNQVPMVDGSGNPYYGVINEISIDSVRMDFNHPMAGIDLCFSGRILDVREPYPDELASVNNSCSGCAGHDHSECGRNCS